MTGTFNKNVFLNSSKNPFYSHDYIAKKFKSLLDENDDRYLYQLRHSFATAMITEGEDLVWVSSMLGHKNSNITLTTYVVAYKLIKDKSERKVRATFLEERHSMGTVNNTDYTIAQEIGV